MRLLQTGEKGKLGYVKAAHTWRCLTSEAKREDQIEKKEGAEKSKGQGRREWEWEKKREFPGVSVAKILNGQKKVVKSRKMRVANPWTSDPMTFIVRICQNSCQLFIIHDTIHEMLYCIKAKDRGFFQALAIVSLVVVKRCAASWHSERKGVPISLWRRASYRFFLKLEWSNVRSKA